MIPGIDFYHDLAPNLSLGKAAGNVGFVIHKLGEGATYLDPLCPQRQKVCGQLAIPFSEYYYIHPEDDANAQADTALLGWANSGKPKRVWQDIEYFTKNNIAMWGTLSLMSRMTKLEQIDARLTEEGILVGYYCSQEFMNLYFPGVGMESFFGQRDLFLADESDGPGRLPLPWEGTGFKLRQTNCFGKFDWYPGGTLDVDQFNGTAEELAVYFRS